MWTLRGGDGHGQCGARQRQLGARSGRRTVFPPLVRRLHISSELDRGAASAARGAEARSKKQRSMHVAGETLERLLDGLGPSRLDGLDHLLDLLGRIDAA